MNKYTIRIGRGSKKPYLVTPKGQFYYLFSNYRAIYSTGRASPTNLEKGEEVFNINHIKLIDPKVLDDPETKEHLEIAINELYNSYRT